MNDLTVYAYLLQRPVKDFIHCLLWNIFYGSLYRTIIIF